MAAALTHSATIKSSSRQHPRLLMMFTLTACASSGAARSPRQPDPDDASLP